MFLEKLFEKESWYVIVVRAGKESSVKEQILRAKEKLLVLDIIIPEPPTKKSENPEVNHRYKDFLGYPIEEPPI